MIIQICVGSSCYLKGSEKIVELFKEAVKRYGLEDEVTLAGSFCTGKCNRTGVTVTINDDVYTGITDNTFDQFFADKVLKVLRSGGK